MIKSEWKLRITKEEFKELYGDSVDSELFENIPSSDEELVQHFLPSKLWRLNNIYKIVDKYAERVTFSMNLSQHRVYAASLEHPRLVILKSRQQGISTFWLIADLDEAIFLTDRTIGLMAQGLDEASTLLKRVKIAWEALPESILTFLGIAITRDNNAEVAFSNGSTVFIRTSFRSATLQCLHISEYGKIAKKNPERAVETKTGSLQAIAPGNSTVIESTAEGDNEFKDMWDDAVEASVRRDAAKGGKFAGKEFKPLFLSWLDDPDCKSDVLEECTPKQAEYFLELETTLCCAITIEQRNFWVQQYRELGDRIYQEYPATPEEAFAKLNKGAYYSAMYMKWVVLRNRVKSNLYDENLEVNVALDLGMDEDDVMTLIYYQRFRNEYRIIEDYTNSDKGLEHYVDHMKDTGYKINWVICPHDIKVRELGTGVSREKTMRSLGVTKLKVLPKVAVVEGIEAFRQVLKDFWIDPRCAYTIGCIKNYSREWDPKARTWRNKAAHNEWSHGADALRYMAMAGVKREAPKKPRQSGSVVDGMAF